MQGGFNRPMQHIRFIGDAHKLGELSAVPASEGADALCAARHEAGLGTARIGSLSTFRLYTEMNLYRIEHHLGAGRASGSLSGLVSAAA